MEKKSHVILTAEELAEYTRLDWERWNYCAQKLGFKSYEELWVKGFILAIEPAAGWVEIRPSGRPSDIKMKFTFEE